MKSFVMKQRIISLLDSYDVKNTDGDVEYTVKSRIAIGHNMEIYDRYGEMVGEIKEKIVSLLPNYEIYINGEYKGRVKKKLSLFQRFSLDYLGFNVEGDLLGFEYSVFDGERKVLDVSKKLIAFADTYRLDIYDDNDTLVGLLIALAIDADKCDNG